MNSIQSIELYLIEPETPAVFGWRRGLPRSTDEQFVDAGYSCLIKVNLEDGLFSSTEVKRGAGIFDFFKRRGHTYLGENVLQTERLWRMAWELDRAEPVTARVRGIIDILAWDLKSKRADLPLYQLLGGHSPNVEAYASTVTWDSVADYEAHIKLCRDVGFRAFKLHAWGDLKEDIALCRALRDWVGPDAVLMFDASGGLDYVQSLELGHALQDLGFLWLEEPMQEHDIHSYTRLCEKLQIPVLAAETTDGAHWDVANWITSRALDMTRMSAQFKTGITGATRIAHLSDSFGMRAQVHGGGLENAHLCAAFPGNDFYEQLVIDRGQIAQLASQKVLPVIDGRISVPSTPGVSSSRDLSWVRANAIAVCHLKA